MTVLYILLALLVFGLLVTIHEGGHFFMARAFGVGVKEFSIGMGPKILSWKGKKKQNNVEKTESEPEENGGKNAFEKVETVYSLRALPVGGYCSMVGEDEESDRPDAFGNVNVWKRIGIVFGGPLMNVLLGFLLTIVLVLCSGPLASNIIADFNEDATSKNYGLCEEDVVLKVNNTRIHTGNELVYEILNSGYEPIDLLVERNGEKILLQDVSFAGMESEGVTFGTPDFRVYAEKTTFASICKHSFFRALSTVKMIYDQIGDLLRGRYGLNAVSGPVGITEGMGEAAKSGFDSFLYLVIVITINLGVFNLLPLPALDGGRLLFLLIEAVSHRPVNKNVESWIHFVGLLILFAIMILVTCKDIVGLVLK